MTYADLLARARDACQVAVNHDLLADLADAVEAQGREIEAARAVVKAAQAEGHSSCALALAILAYDEATT
jgi:hypothetical protein